MILTREPFKGYPDTKSSFLCHKVEKINLFAIRWASPDSDPKLQQMRDKASLIKTLQQVASIAAPKAPSTATGLRNNILRSNEIATSREEYEKMEREFLRSMKL